MIANNLQPNPNTRDDLPFQFLGVPTLLRATADTTNGAFGLIEHPMLPPGFGSPYHVHHREDESFYVLQGRVAFVCDGKWLTADRATSCWSQENSARLQSYRHDARSDAGAGVARRL